MARLNIYLPDELHDLASRWRGTLNLSEICAKALREELMAADASRATINLSRVIREPSQQEQRLLKTYALKDALVANAPTKESVRDELGTTAATYLDRWLCDGAQMAIAGGRQTWSVVRRLSPRNVRLGISALGYGQHDPIALHTHPNTLLTLAWLLYGPRSEAHLVGSAKFQGLWQPPEIEGDWPKYFVIASCSPFSERSPFAQLLGDEATEAILDQGIAGDFAYTFFRRNGDLAGVANVPGVDKSLLSATALKALSERSDARTILIAGGREKAEVAKWALKNRLCNMLVVDSEMAEQLLA